MVARSFSSVWRYLLPVTCYLLLVTCCLLPATCFSQCAMCKAAAESDLQNNPNSLAKGLNTGILFLMVIPYIIVGVIFRKDIAQFFKNIGNKEKTPFNKARLNNLTFLLTFISCTVILFIIFISFYKPY
jgi:heme/copper-type cytochrome/quinol oxidase subunit 2